jgi:hypothetical protein
MTSVGVEFRVQPQGLGFNHGHSTQKHTHTSTHARYQMTSCYSIYSRQQEPTIQPYPEFIEAISSVMDDAHVIRPG